MTLTELFPEIEALPRADKLQLVRRLAADLALEKQLEDLAGKTIEIWSPHDSFEAAATLHRLLEENQEFDVCIYGSRSTFEIAPKGTP